MITEDVTHKNICAFCASDYHLEMILLPYLIERVDKEKILIFTQDNLEDTVKVLLDKINISEISKEKILNINWNIKNNIDELIEKENSFIAVINGKYDFIKEINNKLKEFDNKNIKIVDCFHIEDINVDINKLSQNYEFVLNTKKL